VPEATSAPLLATDIWLAGHADRGEVEARQRRRLRSLVSLARRRSRFYRELHAEVPEDVDDHRLLPPTGKLQLMERFDDWVTDERVSLAGVRAFLADPDRIGDLYLGDYGVWKTSGTSGHVGYFLHDQDALQIYDLLLAIRGWSRWMDPAAAWAFAASGGRTACITASEDHFAGISSWRRIAQRYFWFAPFMRDFSVLAPLPDLVDGLNAWQPSELVAYPSVLSLLAQEQAAGRLRIRPALILAGGEFLDPVEHARIEDAFAAPVRGVYACSECDYVAFGCAHGWLHVNADWVILEPVNEALEPVPAGEASTTCLVTNLANEIQPILRYDLGDSVLVRPDPCPCGNLLPAIQVEGRRNQIMRFPAADGRLVAVLPMAITTVLDTIEGLRRFQIVQTAAEAISVRCEFEPGAEREAIVGRVLEGLRRYLLAQGLPRVRVSVTPETPRSDPRSGKFEQVQVRRRARTRGS